MTSRNTTQHLQTGLLQQKMAHLQLQNNLQELQMQMLQLRADHSRVSLLSELIQSHKLHLLRFSP